MNDNFYSNLSSLKYVTVMSEMTKLIELPLLLVEYS